MKKSFIIGAMLLAAAAAYTADQVIDLSTPAAWNGKYMTAGKDAGTLSVKVGTHATGKNLYPIDGKHTYSFSGSVYSPAGKFAGATFAGFLFYDKDKKLISQTIAVSAPKSKTELVEDVKAGSDTIKVKANKQWKALGHYWVGFNVQDGKLCRDISSSPIKAIKTEGDIMIVTMKKTLKKAYTAGTKVRIQMSGSYFYTDIVRKVDATEKKFTAKAFKQNQFWVEAAYISPMILVNWSLPAKYDKNNLEVIYKDLKLVIKEIK